MSVQEKLNSALSTMMELAEISPVLVNKVFVSLLKKGVVSYPEISKDYVDFLEEAEANARSLNAELAITLSDFKDPRTQDKMRLFKRNTKACQLLVASNMFKGTPYEKQLKIEMEQEFPKDFKNRKTDNVVAKIIECFVDKGVKLDASTITDKYIALGHNTGYTYPRLRENLMNHMNKNKHIFSREKKSAAPVDLGRGKRAGAKSSIYWLKEWDDEN